jgi:hypothetical protein
LIPASIAVTVTEANAPGRSDTAAVSITVGPAPPPPSTTPPPTTPPPGG